MSDKFRYNLTDTLTNKEIDQLIDCGKAIQEDLMCDATVSYTHLTLPTSDLV